MRDLPKTWIHRAPLLLLLLAALAPARAQDDEAAAAQARRQRALHEAGRVAPVTLYPVRVLERADERVAEALGLVLESHGMADLDVAAAAFVPPPAMSWDGVPAAFGAHVAAAARPANARYSLYAEILGTPRTGPQEVRFVLVDGDGQAVLVDRQTPADADFARTAGRDPDPLGCVTLVAERLFRLAAWKRAPGSVREPKFAQRWRERSGVPDEAELAAMKRRVAALRQDVATARIAVLPTCWGGAHDGDSSGRLAALLADEFGCAARALPGRQGLAVAPSSNEQKRLWDLARALQAAVREQAVDADYVLVADIGLDPAKRAGYVHLAVCTAAGEFVLADFVNDQHPLFARRKPTTLAEAEQLAAARLRELWR